MFPSPTLPEPRDSDQDPGLIPVYGRCAPWCQTDGPASGQTVAEHGHVCEGRGFPVDAWGAREDARTVWASLVQHYRHGAYAPEDVHGRPAVPLVQLVWEDDHPEASQVWGAFITPSSARSLAAALVRLADTAERLDLPARKVRDLPAGQLRELVDEMTATQAHRLARALGVPTSALLEDGETR
ncbi:hypothetical protein ACFWD3_06360 [Micrococcus luteus]|uniref:hypothetical protein n=1 Tax=Micrococcus luteus TaxID=1270 RepID=UPI0008B67516|nr:hypothetical protein HMPREF3102_03385 [Micrococcus sp. HMSC30C05]